MRSLFVLNPILLITLISPDPDMQPVGIVPSVADTYLYGFFGGLG